MNTRRLAGRLQRRAIRPAHRLITSYCSALTRRVAWPRGRVDSTQAFIRRTSRSGGKSRLLRVPCCGGGRRGEVRDVAQGRSAHALVRDPLRAHPRISSLVESIPESLEDPLLVVGVGGALEHTRKVFELAVFHVLERLGLNVGERMGSRGAGRAASLDTDAMGVLSLANACDETARPLWGDEGAWSPRHPRLETGSAGRPPPRRCRWDCRQLDAVETVLSVEEEGGDTTRAAGTRAPTREGATTSRAGFRGPKAANTGSAA